MSTIPQIPSPSPEQEQKAKRGVLVALTALVSIVIVGIILTGVFLLSMALALLCVAKKRSLMSLLHLALAWFLSPIYLLLRILARWFPKSGFKAFKC